MRCMCGSILEVAGQDDGRRSSCGVCRRRFDVRFTEDDGSGQKALSLHYLSEDRRSGETSTVGGGTTSFMMPGPESAGSTPGPGLLSEPEQPDEAHFRCPCQALLAIPKALYEKRTSCPHCGARMLIFLLWDAQAKSFTLQHFNLIDRKSGETKILSKI
jgi:hypothetical protein